MPRLYSFVTTALAVALAVSAQHAPGRAPRRFGRASKLTASRSPLGASVALPSTVNCTWSNFTQDVDHFARGAQSATFDQRICTYPGFMKDGADARPDLVLFYTGNESPVDEYINNTGLMWEAPGALGLSNVLLVFAEHRFEGESLLPTVGMENCMAYGTVEQALADYATIISSLQAGFPESKAGSKAAAKVPVVAVGGSYGGMLASWLRMKYPSAVVGAIAGSAPIWGFPLTDVPLDSSAVATTRSFTTVGGAGSDRCADNLLSAWSLMDVIGTTDEGREFLQDAFKLCSPLNDHAAVKELIQGVSGVFFDLAEANYPFESTYITSAVGPGYYPLPAWPLRVACANGLESDHEVTIDGDKTSVSYTVNAAAVDSDGAEGVTVSVEWDSAKGAKTYTLEEIEATHIPALFDGVREAWAVWCNVTGELQV